MGQSGGWTGANVGHILLDGMCPLALHWLWFKENIYKLQKNDC